LGLSGVPGWVRVGRRGGELGGRGVAAIDAQCWPEGARRVRRDPSGEVRSVWMVRFSNQLVAEAVQPFWAALQAGEFLTDAAALAGTHRWRGLRWVREAGGVRPRRGRDLKGRCLSFAEREEIGLGRAAGESMRVIAGRLGRSPRRSAGSSRVTRAAPGATAPRRRTRSRMSARAGPSRPSWLSTWCCASRCRTICSGATRRSRSPAGYAASSPRIGRCGCQPKRSISRSTCNPAARCAAIWPAVCAPGGRCAGPADHPLSARAACYRT